MSSTSRGKRAEGRWDAILANLGYRMVAKACNRGFYRGGQWQSGGAIDLMDAFDFVHVHPNRGILFSQVCHKGGESPRRAKLREAVKSLPDANSVVLAAWDHDTGSFRVGRWAEDFLDSGWRMDSNSKAWPWEEPSKQVPL